jgi:hypothetical protein
MFAESKSSASSTYTLLRSRVDDKELGAGFTDTDTTTSLSSLEARELNVELNVRGAKHEASDFTVKVRQNGNVVEATRKGILYPNRSASSQERKLT